MSDENMTNGNEPEVTQTDTPTNEPAQEPVSQNSGCHCGDKSEEKHACPYCYIPGVQGNIRWDTAVEVITNGGITDDERRKLAGIEEGANKTVPGAGLAFSEEDGSLMIDEEVMDTLNSKADNVVFDENSRMLQLTSNDEPIGDAVHISAGETISGAYINASGELVIVYMDGHEENVGHVVGKDGENGKVYIPHVDEHNVLTWTLEEEVPPDSPSVDLKPEDDWSDIDEPKPASTDFVWSSL